MLVTVLFKILNCWSPCSIQDPLILVIKTVKSSKSRVKPRQQSKTNTVWTANDEDNTSIYTIHSFTGESVEPETIRIQEIASEKSKDSEEIRITSGIMLKIGYYKHSFDRFGDDLCEVIISYLPLYHKLKYECVSKQWQRTIFNRHYHLDVDKCIEIYENEFVKHNRRPRFWNSFSERLENIITKCAFIKSVTLYRLGWNIRGLLKYCDKSEEIVKKALNLFADNCEHLISFRFTDLLLDFKSNECQNFFEKRGNKLRHIDNEPNWWHCIYSIEELNPNVIQTNHSELLRLCPNLESLPLICLYDLIDENSDQVLVPKVTEIALYCSDCRIGLMEKFVDRYGRNIKKLLLAFAENLSLTECSQYLSHVSNLTRIESLGIAIYSTENPSEFSFNNAMQRISSKCTKLVSLKLYLNGNQSLINAFVRSLNYFTKITHLYLGYNAENYEDYSCMSSESFKCCKQLTHLTLHACSYVSESFFTDMHQYLPNLKVLRIEESRRITVALKESFERLKNLKELVINGQCIENIINDIDILTELANERNDITVYYNYVIICFNYFMKQKIPKILKRVKWDNVPNNLMITEIV